VTLNDIMYNRSLSLILATKTIFTVKQFGRIERICDLCNCFEVSENLQKKTQLKYGSYSLEAPRILNPSHYDYNILVVNCLRLKF
jgi:hypothetical protein